jgi:hypothetical protein
MIGSWTSRATAIRSTLDKDLKIQLLRYFDCYAWEKSASVG